MRAWLGEPAGPAELDPAATVADGIAVVRPAIGDAVLDAVRRGGGGMVAVTDDALLQRGRDVGRAGRAWAPNPPGRRPWRGWNGPSGCGMVDRSETVVLLVTGRELKASGTPVDPSRVAVAGNLEQVERAVPGDW